MLLTQWTSGKKGFFALKMKQKKGENVTQGDTEAVERCIQQLSVIVFNIISDGRGLHFFKLSKEELDQASRWNRRFRVSKNTVICENIFRKMK